MGQAEERFLIVGTGRCGSSLLSAILTHAGADFDMPLRSEWDRGGGEYEHPLLLEAWKWFVRAEKISKGPFPSRLRDYCLRRVKAELERLLQRAVYIKHPRLVQLVPLITSLGYKPSIILVYRRFPEYCFSRHRKNAYTFLDCVHEYVDVNTTGLMELYMYGGCAVSYEEIVNLEEKEWIRVLGEVTGLSWEALEESRRALVQEVRSVAPPDVPLTDVEPRVHQVYQILSGLKGHVIRPTR